MDKKIDMRYVFMKQPAYFFLLDGSDSIASYQFNKICETLNDMGALLSAMTGSLRMSGMGVYYISKKPICSFEMQTLRYKFSRFHFALEDIKILKETNKEPYGPEVWKHCLASAVQQYKDFMQSQFGDSIDWSPLQIVVITHPPLTGVLQAILDVMPLLKTSTIKKIQILSVIPAKEVIKIPDIDADLPAIERFSEDLLNEEQILVNLSNHLMEIHDFGNDILHFEKFIKSSLHDISNDSEHLRIHFPSDMVLHCDMQETMLNPDLIAGVRNFNLAMDVTSIQATMPSLKNNLHQVPVHEVEVVGTIPTYGTCLNSLYGSPIIISPTTCWKKDWSLLQKNKHLFSAIREQLENRQQLLVVRMKGSAFLTNGQFNISHGYFGVFAPRNRNIMYVKAIVPKELLLPEHPLADYEIPADTPLSLKNEVQQRLDELPMYDECNPLNFSSELGQQLTRMLNQSSLLDQKRKFPSYARQSHRGCAYSKKRGTHAPPLAATNFFQKNNVALQHDEAMPNNDEVGKVPEKRDQTKVIEALKSVKNLFD